MDPETAIEIGRSWGVQHFELKTLWENRRIPAISDAQLAHLKRCAENYGIDYVTLSPGLFIATEAREELAAKEVTEKLPRTIEMAHELGAQYMIVFSFKKTEGVSENFAIDQLGKAVDMAKGSGLTLVIEPLVGNYCDSGQALARVVRGVDDPILRVNWDPGTVESCGYRAYPDEYLQVKDFVSYVHLKDYSAARSGWTVYDQGDVDIRGTVRALERDSYAGFYSIETHTRFNKMFSRVLQASQHNVRLLAGWVEHMGAVDGPTAC